MVPVSGLVHLSTTLVVRQEARVDEAKVCLLTAKHSAMVGARREAGLTQRNVLHLLTLLVASGALAAFMLGWLGWFEEAEWPRSRATVVALGIVLQLNSVYNAM